MIARTRPAMSEAPVRVRTTNANDDGRIDRTEFTKRDAQRAGLLSDSRTRDKYAKWLDDMLFWRAVSRHAKRYWSDALLGLEVAEVARTFTKDTPAPTTELAGTPPAGPDPLLEAAAAAGDDQDGE